MAKSIKEWFRDLFAPRIEVTQWSTTMNEDQRRAFDAVFEAMEEAFRQFWKEPRP